MRKFFNQFILLIFICTTYAFAQEEKIEITPIRNPDKSVTFNFSKNDPGTMTVQFKFKDLENSSINGPAFQALGYSGSLLTLRPTNKEQNIGYSYSYRFIKGKLKPKIELNFIYGLPYSSSVDVLVTEASYLSARYFGNTEPDDWKSYYLFTNSEESVLASRKGILVEVVDSHEDFKDQESFKTKIIKSISNIKMEH